MGRLNQANRKAISEPAQAVLSAATVASVGGQWHVTINGGVIMERSLYQEVNAALESIGGNWNRKAKAHVFATDPTTEIAAMNGAFVVLTKNPFDFFATPARLVQRILRDDDLLELSLLVAGSSPGVSILEPSGGSGAFLDGLLDYYRDNAKHDDLTPHIATVEIDPVLASPLSKKYAEYGVEVIQGDFLTTDPATVGVFDRVIMNPPFTSKEDGAAWMTHIYHAVTFLNPGGVLVAIVPGGATSNGNRRHTEFRNFVNEQEGEFFTVEADAFKESGTNVNTAIVRLRNTEGNQA